MLTRSLRPWPLFLILGGGLLVLPSLRGQDAAPDDAPPPVPKGVEVLARGPVHEAFATLTAEPQPTKAVAKKPPKPLQEMPPDEKPEGDSSGSAATGPGTTTATTSSGSPASGARRPRASSGWPATGASRATLAVGARLLDAHGRQGETTPRTVTYYPSRPMPPAVAPPGHARPGHLLRPRPLGMERHQHYAWRCRLLGARAAQLRLDRRPLPLDAGRLRLRCRLLGLLRQRRGILYAPVVVDPSVVDASLRLHARPTPS